MTGFDRLEAGGRRWGLARDQSLIGRFDERVGAYPEVDLTELDPGHSVSRRHAVVERRREGPVFRDLGSANGSSVDGRPAVPGHPVLLRSGVIIRVGDVDLAFWAGAAPPTQQPSARPTSEQTADDVTGTLLGRARPAVQQPAKQPARVRRRRRR